MAAIVGNPGKSRGCLHRNLTYVPSDEKPGVMLECCLACGRMQEIAPSDYGVYEKPEKKIVPKRKGSGRTPRENPDEFVSPELAALLHSWVDTQRARAASFGLMPAALLLDGVRQVKEKVSPHFRGRGNNLIKARAALAQAQSFDEIDEAIRLLSARKNGSARFTADPRGMTPAQINKELDALSARGSVANEAMIAAGRGHERYGDLIARGRAGSQDPIEQELAFVADRNSALRDEITARYGPGAPSRMPAGFKKRQNPDQGCPVFNARTGEVRLFADMDPASATLAAHAQDNPWAPPATAQLYGHVRAGEWCGKQAEYNGDPMGKNWAKVLDTVHYAMTDPVQSKKQGHRGVATLSREAWLKRFAKGKSHGAQDKAWHDLLAFVQGADQQGYGMLAGRRPGWIDLTINAVYDAAWLEQPGTQHQLGHPREEQLLRERYSGYELAGRLADREDHWDTQGAAWDVEPEEHEIPGGSMDAYRSLLEEVRRGEVATQEGRGSVTGSSRRNPQEQVTTRPKEIEYDMDEFRGHPGFDESGAIVRRFHDADPARVVVFELPDGKKKVTWEPVHAFLHEVTETNYQVPDFMKSSVKHQGANPDMYRGHPQGDPGLWTHKHYEGKRKGRLIGLPVEAMHPFTKSTRKILRGSVVDEWWES